MGRALLGARRMVGRRRRRLKRARLASDAVGFVLREVGRGAVRLHVRRHPRGAPLGERRDGDDALREHRQEGEEREETTAKEARGGGGGEHPLKTRMSAPKAPDGPGCSYPLTPPPFAPLGR